MRRIAVFWAACALPAIAGPALAQQVFAKGEAVEIEASKHWVPCVVVDPGELVVRVNCTPYPALSRAAGNYVVSNSPASIRKATGKIGPAAPAAKPAATAAPKANGVTGLKVGEYACYGSGGRPMIGLGFKVLPGNRFTDLDGKNAGTFTISGGTVTFKGGHLGGQTGRDLKNGTFRIGAQASCEPW